MCVYRDCLTMLSHDKKRGRGSDMQTKSQWRMTKAETRTGIWPGLFGSDTCTLRIFAECGRVVVYALQTSTGMLMIGAEMKEQVKTEQITWKAGGWPLPFHIQYTHYAACITLAFAEHTDRGRGRAGTVASVTRYTVHFCICP